MANGSLQVALRRHAIKNMAAFDRLPPDFHRLINEAKYPVEPVNVLKAVKQFGVDQARSILMELQ